MAARMGGRWVDSMLTARRPHTCDEPPSWSCESEVRFRTLADIGDTNNLTFSPGSLAMALGMTLAGAEGATAEELRRVLHLDLPPARLHFLIRDRRSGAILFIGRVIDPSG